MPDPTHITVTAPPGKLTPIHRDDGAEPGGGLMYVASGEIRRVRLSQAIRRSIARTDLIPCDMNGAGVGIALAAAPDELTGGRIVIAELRATKPGKASS